MLGYTALGVFVLMSYVAVLGTYFRFTSLVLPVGDPFTYTVGWFQLLEKARAGYFSTIGDLLAGSWGGWYRLMYLSIAVLSPMLVKEPAVLAVVNYVAWFFAACAFYRLGRHLGFTTGKAFICGLVPWIWPLNYGFSDYSSIPVLALDASFNGALFFAVASTFVFAIDPKRTANAIIAGVSIGSLSGGAATRFPWSDSWSSGPFCFHCVRHGRTKTASPGLTLP